MPVYEYRCENAGHLTEILLNGNPFKSGFKIPESTKCEVCGDHARRVYDFKCNFNKPFKDYVDEHIADKPIHIKSAKHKREVLKAHGLRQKNDPFH